MLGLGLTALLGTADGGPSDSPPEYVGYADSVPEPIVYDTSHIQAEMYDKNVSVCPPPGLDFESYAPDSGAWYHLEGGVWDNHATMSIEPLPYGKPPKVPVTVDSAAGEDTTP